MTTKKLNPNSLNVLMYGGLAICIIVILLVAAFENYKHPKPSIVSVKETEEYQWHKIADTIQIADYNPVYISAMTQTSVTLSQLVETSNNRYCPQILAVVDSPGSTLCTPNRISIVPRGWTIARITLDSVDFSHGRAKIKVEVNPNLN